MEDLKLKITRRYLLVFLIKFNYFIINFVKNFFKNYKFWSGSFVLKKNILDLILYVLMKLYSDDFE